MNQVLVYVDPDKYNESNNGVLITGANIMQNSADICIIINTTSIFDVIKVDGMHSNYTKIMFLK